MDLDNPVRGGVSQENEKTPFGKSPDDMDKQIKALSDETSLLTGAQPDEVASQLAKQTHQDDETNLGSGSGLTRLGFGDLLGKSGAADKLADLIEEGLDLSPELAQSIAGSVLKLLGEKQAKPKPRKKDAAKPKKPAKAKPSAKKKAPPSGAKKKGKTSSSKKITASPARKKTTPSKPPVKKKNVASQTRKTTRNAEAKKTGNSSISSKGGTSPKGKPKTSVTTKKSTHAS